MLDKKQIDLINQHVDGTNTEKEQASVRKLLEKSAEARILIQELQSLKATLKSVQPLDPPSYLKQHIMNSLPRSASPVQPARRESWLGVLFSNPRHRYVYTFAGGAFAGILLFALFMGYPNDSSDVSDAYGTIGSAERSSQFASEVTVPIDLPETSGSIRTKYSPYVIISELTVSSKNDVDLVLTFDRSKLKFDGFRQAHASQSYVEIQEGMLKWTNRGQNTYSIIFVNESGATPPITAKLLAAGTTVYEAIIDPTQKN